MYNGVSPGRHLGLPRTTGGSAGPSTLVITDQKTFQGSNVSFYEVCMYSCMCIVCETVRVYYRVWLFVLRLSLLLLLLKALVEYAADITFGKIGSRLVKRSSASIASLLLLLVLSRSLLCFFSFLFYSLLAPSRDCVLLITTTTALQRKVCPSTLYF